MSLCINPQCKQPSNSNTQLFCHGCGSELLIDGKYRILQELGQGGFGTTYEVLDLNSEPRVLKVLMDNHPKYVELFEQEAEVLGLLNHPGIPKIDPDGYFIFFPREQKQPLHCIVMEKIEGMDLEHYIQRRGNRPIPQKRALRWLAELSLILDRVHSCNFFHRDIKPSNIMLRANGYLALIDFGTARQLTATYLEKQAGCQVTGVISSGYTPMEQMRGQAVQQSDFYALGGTMIYLLTAKEISHFYSPQKNKMQWHEAVEDISPQFADLIDRMMAFLPSQRPQTAMEIFNEIITIDSSLQGLEKYFGADTVSDFSPAAAKVATTVSQQDAQTILNTDNDLSLRAKRATFIAESRVDRTNEIKQPEKTTPISAEFIARCRRELAEVIGPMANIICDRVVKQHPNISKIELIAYLTEKIANPEQVKQLQQRLL